MSTFENLCSTLSKRGFDLGSLEGEMGKIVESRSVSMQTKRGQINDTLWKMNNCLRNKDNFANIFLATSIMNTITPSLLPSDETYPVTFFVMFSIFQSIAFGLQQFSERYEYYYNKKVLHDAEKMQENATMLEDQIKKAPAHLRKISENSSRCKLENLLNEVPVEKCTEFLGSLKERIENLLLESSFDSVHLAILYINLYARLAILRAVTFWQIYCLKKGNIFGQQSAESISSLIQMNETVDRQVVSFLSQPIYERAVFLTLFHPSKNKDFMNFLKANGVKLPNLANNELQERCTYTIHPSAWPHWRMEMGWDVDGSVWGNDEDRMASHFQFEPVEHMECDNIFYIRSCKWSKYYVYMRNNPWGFLAGMKDKPDSEGKWKVIKVKSEEGESFLMSPLKWPCYFIYMTYSLWGQVRGTFGHEVKEKVHKGLWEIRKY